MSSLVSSPRYQKLHFAFSNKIKKMSIFSPKKTQGGRLWTKGTLFRIFNIKNRLFYLMASLSFGREKPTSSDFPLYSSKKNYLWVISCNKFFNMHRPFKGLILGEKKKLQKPPPMGPAIEGWGEGVNFGLLNFHDSSLVGGGP